MRAGVRARVGDDLLVRAGLDVDAAHVCAQQPRAILHHDGLDLARGRGRA